RWQKRWTDQGLGQAEIDKDKEKFMMIFAYPGISGFLHVGHMRGFSYTDAICRYKRLKGFNVLFPVGTHASGNQAIAFANKVKNKDPDWINYLLNNGYPKNKLPELEDPRKVIAYFNGVYINDYWKRFGFLCDWERFTCTSFPDYEKFIQWQFKKLRDKNLLVQKPYFATACIKCGPVAVDPSETDISSGGNAEKQEYTLLKFKLGDDFLIAATLRPETVYGQTNLWINPHVNYVRVGVEGENWIMSREAAEKLSYQKDDVILREDVPAQELLGKYALAPAIHREIIILPAEFCDPKVGSGIVTSVPSDAPYDYTALKELWDDRNKAKKFGLDYEEIRKIQLIPIIKSKGFGDYPAKEIVEKLGIKSLADKEKLEEATREIYKAGFHTGVMKENCGKYAGMKVEEAKERIKEKMMEKGEADIFHDLTEEVICRCGGKVIIKRIDDQWFIKYSDEELTEKSKEWAGKMQIWPEEYYRNLPGVLEWFGDRACARLGNWTGSKFPFDDRWTVEPISDSTLYPAYYIVAKFFNNGTLKINDLTEEFFDHVFLGKGEAKKAIWKEVQKEFAYFYPLDVNLGGKEHKTVHFPVFLMNHIAILPAEKWPKGIFVNWWVTGKGSKISKSKGGAVPIPDAIANYGVDAMRLYYSHIGSPHVDVVWTEEVVHNYKTALERIINLTGELRGIKGGKKKIDQWLLSRVYTHLDQAEEAMEKFDLRELANITYFNLYDDLRWYLRRGGANQAVLKEVFSIWCRMINPITPHLSEELNTEKILVSSSSWPLVEEAKINLGAEAGEEMIHKLLEGMRNVIELAKLEKVSKFTLFIAERWLYDLFAIVKREIEITRNMGEIIKKVLGEEQLKVKGKEVSKIIGMLLKDVSKLPKLLLSQEEELEVVESAKEFLEKEFGCSVEIVLADKSEHHKARTAMPGKVGVLVE
ncbi:MAG: leucine--tRNA ligase, partial [Candidatus Woesearchaeota archaeon]